MALLQFISTECMIGLFGGFLLFFIIFILNLSSQVGKTTLYYANTKFNQTILSVCPAVKENYVPTFLWGKNGHIQSLLFAKVGRFSSPQPDGERHHIIMPDGATVTYDLFQPHENTVHKNVILFLCPGIGNSSENIYIKTAVHCGQSNGFAVACMNHLGAIKTMKITSHRIFSYGDMNDMDFIINDITQKNPGKKFVAVGYSMGANMLLKYLGEHPHQQKHFLAAVSAGQGYDIEGSAKYYDDWANLRRAYAFVVSNQVKKILKAHRNMLFCDGAQKKYGPFDCKQIFAASSQMDIDDLYGRKVAGFSNTGEYYRNVSCKHCLHQINIPVLIINSLDDPFVIETMLEIPKNLAETKPNVIFATTKHGGHLGFFEGGLAVPNTLSWLDRVVMEYCNAVCV